MLTIRCQPQISIPKLLQELETFGKVSVLRVNKTDLFPLAHLVIRELADLSEVGLHWELDKFKYLGIQIAHTAYNQYSYYMGRVIQGLKKSVQC